MVGEWQNVVALVIVLAAASYLVRRGWRSIANKRAGRCGACGSCPAGGEGGQTAAATHAGLAGKPLVQLDARFKPQNGPSARV